MDIKKISDVNINDAKSFLLSLPKITKIDDEVLKNASVILDNEEIKGIISYEPYRKYGLIRYFIFKNGMKNDDVILLLDDLVNRAVNEGIEYLFSIIANLDIYELFNKLGFEEIDKKYFYVDEESILETKYKNAYIMLKRIV